MQYYSVYYTKIYVFSPSERTMQTWSTSDRMCATSVKLALPMIPWGIRLGR